MPDSLGKKCKEPRWVNNKKWKVQKNVWNLWPVNISNVKSLLFKRNIKAEMLWFLTFWPRFFLSSLFFLISKLWDFSQRREARKHPHQSEKHFSKKKRKHPKVISLELLKFLLRIHTLQQNVLKLGDFGSCRSVYSKPPHTEYISTRWYRAPECLLTDGYYSLKMDIWSAGCVFFEIMR